MTDKTTLDLETLSVLAARVDKRLKWAAFLVGAMLVILVIDLQIKRTIAQQGTDAARSLAVMRGLAAGAERIRADLAGGEGNGQSAGPAAGRDADTGRAVPDGLDGDAAMAAAGDSPDQQGPAAPVRRAPRAGKRTAGNGPGTSRDAGKRGGI